MFVYYFYFLFDVIEHGFRYCLVSFWFLLGMFNVFINVFNPRTTVLLLSRSFRLYLFTIRQPIQKISKCVHYLYTHIILYSITTAVSVYREKPFCSAFAGRKKQHNPPRLLNFNWSLHRFIFLRRFVLFFLPVLIKTFFAFPAALLNVIARLYYSMYIRARRAPLSPNV